MAAVVNAIIDVVRAHQLDKGVLELVCEAVASLGSPDERGLAAACIEPPLLFTLVRAVVAAAQLHYPDDGELLSWTLRLLENASLAESLQPTMAADGPTLELLTSFMIAGSGSKASTVSAGSGPSEQLVIAMSTSVMARLAHFMSIADARAAGVIAALISLMQTSGVAAAVYDAAASLEFLLQANSKDAAEADIVSLALPIAEATVSVMERFRDNVDVCRSGCRAFSRLMTAPAAAAQLSAAFFAEAAAAVVAASRRFRGKYCFADADFIVLGELSKHPAAHDALVAAA